MSKLSKVDTNLSGKLIIPDSITSIGDEAFDYCKNLTSINIPDSVTSIGNGAFHYCENLTSLNLSSSITTIGNRAFSWCKKLINIIVDENNSNYKSKNGVLFDKNETTLIAHPNKNSKEYIIPSGVTTIGSGAFEGNVDGLTSINIPDSVKYIEDCAFDYCKNLTSVNLPSGVITIGNRAFSYCNNLISINIPDSVQNIGDKAFYDCTSLFSVTIPKRTLVGFNAFSGVLNVKNLNGTSTSYGALSVNGYIDGNVIYNNENKTKILMVGNKKNITEFTLPDSITSIGEMAFAGCSSLTSIIIPEDVTSIGEMAFAGCSSLTSIIIPENVKGIEERAFSGCSSLISVYILSNTTTGIGIGREAFYKCYNLKTIIIPKNVRYSDEFGTFYGCNNLPISYCKPNTAYCIIDGVLYTGIYNDKYYENGLLFTGIYNGQYYENGVLATPAYATITESNGALNVTGDYKEIANEKGTTLYLETLDVTESNGTLTINSNNVKEIPNEKGTTLYI